LWLIKIWFTASTFVLKIATFAKPETVMRHPIGHPTQFEVSHNMHQDRQPFAKLKELQSRHTKANCTICSTFNFARPHPSPPTTPFDQGFHIC
jgi:hypothetical protein